MKNLLLFVSFCYITNLYSQDSVLFIQENNCVDNEIIYFSGEFPKDYIVALVISLRSTNVVYNFDDFYEEKFSYRKYLKKYNSCHLFIDFDRKYFFNTYKGKVDSSYLKAAILKPIKKVDFPIESHILTRSKKLRNLSMNEIDSLYKVYPNHIELKKLKNKN